MNPKHFAALGLMTAFLLAPAATRAADTAALADKAAATRNRVVFQVNEDDSRKWNTVLANINNVQEELGRVVGIQSEAGGVVASGIAHVGEHAEKAVVPGHRGFRLRGAAFGWRLSARQSGCCCDGLRGDGTGHRK